MRLSAVVLVAVIICTSTISYALDKNEYYGKITSLVKQKK